MKVVIAIGVAVVLPFGFLMLAGLIVNHVLAKRRHPPPARLQTPIASTQDNCTGQSTALPLCTVRLQRAAV